MVVEAGDMVLATFGHGNRSARFRRQGCLPRWDAVVPTRAVCCRTPRGPPAPAATCFYLRLERFRPRMVRTKSQRSLRPNRRPLAGAWTYVPLLYISTTKGA